VTRAVEASGIAWTHLWPGDFFEPWPHAAGAPIGMDDIAAVAAVALLDDGHRGRAHSLTGRRR
jgi:uncharacterized protein YbjT (DUF2867 family)